MVYMHVYDVIFVIFSQVDCHPLLSLSLYLSLSLSLSLSPALDAYCLLEVYGYMKSHVHALPSSFRLDAASVPQQ